MSEFVARDPEKVVRNLYLFSGLLLVVCTVMGIAILDPQASKSREVNEIPLWKQFIPDFDGASSDQTSVNSDSDVVDGNSSDSSDGNGNYELVGSDGLAWSCGTLFNPENTDHVLNVPVARFPEDIFKRLDFDGILEGPYMIDFHVRQEIVDTLDAEVMHRAASGAGACILQSMTEPR